MCDLVCAGGECSSYAQRVSGEDLQPVAERATQAMLAHRGPAGGLGTRRDAQQIWYDLIMRGYGCMC